MNITESLFSPPQSVEPPRWQLLRASAFQALPCRIPFEISCDSHSPAVQAYSMRLHADARRFLELRRLSCGQSDTTQWCLRLLEAILLVEQGRADQGWHELQLALSWRNHREKETVLLDALPSIEICEWLAMSTIALAMENIEAAESYVSEAVAHIEQNANCCISDVLQDTRGDAMTVFACVRLAQHRFQEAETLLELAYDAHLQSGDMEQSAVDLILLSDVEFHGGNSDGATFLLFEADRILSEECDVTRHFRCVALKQAVENRLVELRSGRRHPTEKLLSLN